MAIPTPVPTDFHQGLGFLHVPGVDLSPLFEDLLHRVSDGLAIIDVRGRLVWHNAAFARIANGAPAALCREALGDAPRTLPWHEAGADASCAGLCWSLASGSTRRTLEVEARPLPGDPSRDVLVIRDVTEQRRLERRALESERQETFGIIAASVAHEINNVVVTLGGYADLASSSLHDPAFLETVFNIYTEQCERLCQLTGEFLSLSRPAPEQVQEIDLARELHTVAGMLGQMNRLRKCRLEVRIQAGLPHVRGEGVQIQQMLVNLLVHAAERSSEGGRIEAALGRSACGRRVELALRDTGRPLDAAEQANLVDPFLTPQMNAWVNGLSMLVVRRIAERHGAEIQVGSLGPEGNVVRLLFPFA